MKKKKFDFQLYFLLGIAGFFMLFMAVLAIHMNNIEEKRLQEMEKGAINVDSLRQIHKELRLKTFEDSLHEFEDGF